MYGLNENILRVEMRFINTVSQIQQMVAIQTVYMLFLKKWNMARYKMINNNDVMNLCIFRNNSFFCLSVFMDF